MGSPTRHLKTVRIPRGYTGLHCEVDGCIVNIHTGLVSDGGHAVTAVEVLADQYAGEPKWSIDGDGLRAASVRVVRDHAPETT